MSAEVLPSLRVHPAEDLLEEYAFGRLAEPRLSNLEEHLLLCEACQQRLVTAEQYIAVMKQGTAELAARPLAVDRILRSFVPAWLTQVWSAHYSFTQFTHSRLRTGGLAAAFVLFALFAGGVWRRQLAPAGPPAAIVLTSFRGGESNGIADAPANRILNLRIDATRLTELSGPPSLQIVNASGVEVWHGALEVRAGTETGRVFAARVPSGLKPGQYWVRLYSQEQTIAREYGLRVR